MCVAFGFGELAPTPLTQAMTDAGRLKPAAFPDLAAMQPQWYSNNCRLASSCNDDMATNFQTMLVAMNARISRPGGGSPSRPPRNLMLLVTDGMGDEPGGKGRWVGELSARDRAQCEAIKANGVRIGILYLEYPPAALAGDSWSEAIVAPHLARIEPALRRCASLVNGTPLLVKADLGQNLPEALRALFQRATASPSRAH
jgi:hypothetical protein